MGSILKAFRAIRPLPEVEANIAQLGEELPLTVAFAAVMERHGLDRAAVAAVDEQRTRVANAQRRMLRSLSARRRHHVHAAFAGIAAAMVLASGSFAAMRAIAPDHPANAELIRQASAKLELAKQAGDSTSLAALVNDVHQSLLSITKDGLSDPAINLQLQGLLDREQALLNKAPNAGALLAQLQKVAEQVQVETPEAPKPRPAPKPDTAKPDASSAPEAPAPPGR
ncbi:MAG: hypothetical protein ABR548_05390 [Actinomycetota bacterium]|nr:hypothetical protein [Actinomycetota bacterium]